MEPNTRLAWIDHLRSLVIILVVNMHACVTYSHVGSWYILSKQEPTIAVKIPFILWQAHLQSFFMGLLFFIAGFFAHTSLLRRGPASFIGERLFRLGLPALLYMLVIHPFILIGLNPWNHKFAPFPTFYVNFIRSGQWLSASGPLWFVIALLLFSLALVLIRVFRRSNAATTESATSTGNQLWLFALALGMLTFLVRIVQPIGTSVLNLQLCSFVQYIAFFAAGISAARRGWLTSLAAAPHATKAGWTALVVGPLLLSAILVFGADGGVASFLGGWHWQSLLFSTWEQLAGVGLSLGLLALCSKKLNRNTPLLRWVADRSFGVYVLHTPVLVGLMMLFRPLPQNPFMLSALLTITGLAASFLLADLCRRIPGVRKIV